MQGRQEREGLTGRTCRQAGTVYYEQDATVRQAAKKFVISKSTVHKDVTQRLQQMNPQLWEQVKKVLEHNKQERHIRGGLATKEKYEILRQNKMQKSVDESLKQ